MDIEEFKLFVNSQRWIFAKTYAQKSPHEYCLRRNVISDDVFCGAVNFIRENGFPVKYFGREYICFALDGRLYWTMGEPIDKTILINRNNIRDYEISIKVKPK